MRLQWDDRPYESGVDRGVFYIPGGIGYAWSGLVSVKETTIESAQEVMYVDGRAAVNRVTAGDFTAQVDAITYPREFESYDGRMRIFRQQRRKPFHFSYRTKNTGDGYKIHLVYNAMADPTDRNASTADDGVDISLFSWQFNTLPIPYKDIRNTAHFVIDTTQVYPWMIPIIEDILYGDNDSQPSMPTIEDLIYNFDANALFVVLPNADHSVLVYGPDDAVQEVSPHLWKLDWPSVEQVDEHTYRASTL